MPIFLNFLLFYPHPQLSRNVICGQALTVICFSFAIGSDKQMSRQATSSEKSRPSSPSETSGSPSTRRWPRSTQRSRRSWRTSRPRLATSKDGVASVRGNDGNRDVQTSTMAEDHCGIVAGYVLADGLLTGCFPRPYHYLIDHLSCAEKSMSNGIGTTGVCF